MRLPFRKHDEPPGVWRGDLRLYSRWKIYGATYHLVNVMTELDFEGPGSRIVLEYRRDLPERGRS